MVKTIGLPALAILGAALVAPNLATAQTRYGEPCPPETRTYGTGYQGGGYYDRYTPAPVYAQPYGYRDDYRWQERERERERIERARLAQRRHELRERERRIEQERRELRHRDQYWYRR